jgi:hypothetical protein
MVGRRLDGSRDGKYRVKATGVRHSESRRRWLDVENLRRGDFTTVA